MPPRPLTAALWGDRRCQHSSSWLAPGEDAGVLPVPCSPGVPSSSPEHRAGVGTAGAQLSWEQEQGNGSELCSAGVKLKRQIPPRVRGWNSQGPAAGGFSPGSLVAPELGALAASLCRGGSARDTCQAPTSQCSSPAFCTVLWPSSLTRSSHEHLDPFLAKPHQGMEPGGAGGPRPAAPHG